MGPSIDVFTEEALKISPPIDEAASKAKKLVLSLRKGKKFHDDFADEFRRLYLIAGKSIPDWQQEFTIVIPQDLSPSQCREYDLQLMGMYQVATFYKLVADARHTSLKGTASSGFRESLARIVSEYKEQGKKLPPKATLDNLAEDEQREVADAMIHSEIETNFWKSILSSLDTYRKMIDTISINLGVEAKALQSEKYLDNLSRKVENNRNNGNGYSF